MADATEDLLASGRPQDTSHLSDSEDDDLPPDFLNLARTTKDKNKKTGGTPKRGTKDFEENKTRLQSRALDASRQAMWDALGVVRVHHPTTFKTEKRRPKKKAAAEKREVEEELDQVGSLADWKEAVASEEEHSEPEQESVTISGSGGIPIGFYDADTGQTHIPAAHKRGKIFHSVGRDLSGGGVSLQPEEALWALESSRLDVRYPKSYFDDEQAGNEKRRVDDHPDMEDSGVPISLQGAYAAYIGSEPIRNGNLTLEKYTVFAALKRLGYIVLRAPEFDGLLSSSHREPYTPRDFSRATTETAVTHSASAQTQPTLLTSLHNLLFGSTLDLVHETDTARRKRQALGPLVTPGLYRDYPSIYRLLHLIPASDPLAAPPPAPPRIVISQHRDTSLERKIRLGCLPADSVSAGGVALGSTNVAEDAIEEEEENPYTTTWDVYKPAGNREGGNWRKSKPGEPDFRICVIAARETGVMTLSQCEGLLGEQPVREPPIWKGRDGQVSEKRTEPINAVYSRLRHGYKNVILAVVDEGIVSYVRVADAGFCREKLYERGDAVGGRGVKGGGRGRGRGRGGRGRGGRG